jgi:site-specific recombinase XerD
MQAEWLEDPVGAFRDVAPRLFGYSEGTVREYLRDIGRFLEFIDAADQDDTGRPTDDPPLTQRAGTGRILTVDRAQVEAWLVGLSGRGLRATTINRKIASLRAFFAWAQHVRLTGHSPVLGIRTLKTPRRIPKFLTFDDMERLLAYTGSLRRTSTIRGKQIHAVIALLYYLGLRREELVGLRYEHIEKLADQEICLHVIGKGDKERLLPVPRPAWDAYEGYARYRPECPSQFIFISLKTHKPLSRYDVNSICRQLNRKVPLSRKLTPHVLRHTFATHLHLKGQPIEHINALLGHESLDTTRIYVHIDSGRLRRSVEQLVG